MALADLLGSFGIDPNSLRNAAVLPQRSNPYGGYEFNLAAAPQAQPPATHQPSKFRNFLGALGDALLVAHSQQPLYRQRMDQQQTQTALQGFLTNPDAAIANLMQVDAPSGIALYKAVHPASELPVGVKEYEYEQRLDPTQRGAFEKMLQLTHPGLVAPITLGPGDTYDPGTGGAPGGALPHVTDQKSYDAVPPGAQFTTPDGKIRTKGGQTAGPSGNFP